MCVHVSEETRRRLGDVMEWIDFGAREIKGMRQRRPAQQLFSRCPYRNVCIILNALSKSSPSKFLA